MLREYRVIVAAAAIGFFLVPSAAAETPTRTTHWFSLINETHNHPTGMTVVVLPPGYFSKQAMIDDPSWVGADALLQHPAVQATLEATEYWSWMLRQSEGQFPQLRGVTWTTKVLGVDATLDDVRGAEILVNVAMLNDPLPALAFAGLGLPVLPLFGGGGQDLCLVTDQGLGGSGDRLHPTQLRNLMLHEFGHCIAAGHTGTSLGLNHCSDDFGCFDSHPTDVMSLIFDDHRQCLSNLNVQGLAEGYAWLAAGNQWRPHDGETFMAKSDYATTCMPSVMERF